MANLSSITRCIERLEQQPHRDGRYSLVAFCWDGEVTREQLRERAQLLKTAGWTRRFLLWE